MRLSVYFLLFSFSVASSYSEKNHAKKTQWHGFERHDFNSDGLKCILVIPDSPAKGLPWVWRARFFGHQPQADIELLKKGFHIAYCDVAGLFGNEVAVNRWDRFYDLMTQDWGLSKRPALEGMSRGGLIIYNWAYKNPKKVSCIYGDAPVCD
ncbi:MAG: alpha/beta hydrolase, partial [Verrucomicrobiota bacterium]|nr:alpha/beta hydrolase [Verrucomicrobiota bacterium]